MACQWPADTDFSLRELDVLDRNCPACGRMTHICHHHYRRYQTLDGPVQRICKLNQSPDPRCPGHAKTRSPELEVALGHRGRGPPHDRPGQATLEPGTGDITEREEEFEAL